MDIVSSCDENFVPCYCAMLHSVSLFHPDATYWLLAHGVRAESRGKLERFAQSLQIRLTILEGFQSRLADLPVKDKYPVATYGRLLIPDLLPAYVSRALYLDADITVTAPLDLLFNLNLNGMPLAAAAEISNAANREGKALPPGATYVNSGVLLFDLDAWRSASFGEAVLAYVRNHPKALLLLDQSAVNTVMANRIFVIPPRWNFFYLNDWQAVQSPAVVHYLAGLKPWVDPRSPFTELYQLHQSRTPFPFTAPPKRYLAHARRILADRLGNKRYSGYAARVSRDRLIREKITLPALATASLLIAERDQRLGQSVRSVI